MYACMRTSGNLPSVMSQEAPTPLLIWGPSKHKEVTNPASSLAGRGIFVGGWKQRAKYVVLESFLFTFTVKVLETLFQLNASFT